MADERITAIITAKDKASPAFKSLGMSVISANQAIELLNKGLTALSAPFRSVIKEGSEFAAQMSTVKSISKITTEDFKALSKEAERIGETTAFTATQAAQGMEELSRAGFDAAKTIAITADAMDLAAAQAADLGETARLVGIAFKLFSDQGLSAKDIVDDFNKSVGASAQNIVDFTEAFKFAAGQASAFNQPLSEVTKSIALLADVGFRGTLAGTALRGAITKLAKPTNDALEVLDDLNLSFTDINPEVNNFTDILKKLRDAGISNAQVLTLFGQIAGGKFIKVIQDINTLLPEYEKKLNRAKTAQESASDRLDNLRGDVIFFGSALSGLKIRIFKIMDNALRITTQAATELTKAFTAFVKVNEKDIKVAFESLRNIFKSLLNAISPIVDYITAFYLPIWDNVKTAFNAIVAAVEPVIQNFIDFIKVTVELVTANKDIQTAIQNVIDIFKFMAQILSPIIDFLIDLAKKQIPLLVKILGILYKGITQVVRDGFQIFAQIIKELEPIFSGIVKWVGEVSDTFSNWLDTVLKPINNFLDNQLLKTFSSLYEGFKELIGISDGVEKSQEKIKDSFVKTEKAASDFDKTLTGNTVTVSLRETQSELNKTQEALQKSVDKFLLANRSAKLFDDSLKGINAEKHVSTINIIFNAFDRLGEKINKLGGEIVQRTSNFGVSISEFGSKTIKEIKNIGKGFSGFGGTIAKEFGNLGKVFSGFGGTVKKEFGNIGKEFEGLGKKTKKELNNVGKEFAGLENKAQAHLELVGDVIKTGLLGFKREAILGGEALGDFYKKPQETLKQTAKVIKEVKDVAQETANAIGEIEEPIQKVQKVVDKLQQPASKGVEFDFKGIGDFGLSDIKKMFTISKEAVGRIQEDFGERVAQSIPGISGAISGAAEGGGLAGGIAGFFFDLLMRTEGFQEAMEILGEALIELMEPLGKVLIPIAKFLAKIIRKIAPAIEAIAKVLVKILTPLLPIIEEMAIFLADLIVSLVPLVEMLVELLAPILELVRPLLPLLTEFMKVFMPAFKLAIITAFAPIIMPIIVMAAAIKMIQGLFERLAGAFDIFKGMFAAFMGIFRNLMGFIQNAFNFVQSFLSTVVSVLNSIKKLLEPILDAIKKLGSGAGGGISSIWGGIKSGFDSVKSAFGFQQGSIGLTRDQLLRLPGMEAGSGLIKAHIGEQVGRAGVEGGVTNIFNIQAIDPRNQVEEIRQIMESLDLQRKLGISG